MSCDARRAVARPCLDRVVDEAEDLPGRGDRALLRHQLAQHARAHGFVDQHAVDLQQVLALAEGGDVVLVPDLLEAGSQGHGFILPW
jgi:hypothetical protein